MSAEVKRYTISICHDSYSLVTDESEVNVLTAAARVDAAMREIIGKMPGIEPKKAAILAAMKISLELSKVHQQQEDTQQVLKNMLSKIEVFL